MTKVSSRQTGFSLLEVLVSVIVISIGLLGMSALQARANKQASEAYTRSIALANAEALAEKIRVSVADNIYAFDANADPVIYRISSYVACYVGSGAITNSHSVCGTSSQSLLARNYLASQTAAVSGLASGSITVRLWRNNAVVTSAITPANCDYSLASGSSSNTPCSLSVVVSWRESVDNTSSPQRSVEYFVR